MLNLRNLRNKICYLNTTKQSKYLFSTLNDNLRFSNKIVIVTGGGAGIGESCCLQFAKEGSKVVVVDTHKQNGLKVTNQINKTFNNSSHFILADISNEIDAKRIIDETIEKFGGVDILINNAGKIFLKGIEATVQDFESSYRINVIGTFLVTKYAIESMKTRGGGAIVNLSSKCAWIAQPYLFAYSVTKAAVLQMTRDMALDFGKYNIRVNAICPGTILTKAVKDIQASGGEETEKFFEPIIKKTIMKRLGNPEEIATVICFLASSDASYITGTHLMADGGYTTI